MPRELHILRGWLRLVPKEWLPSRDKLTIIEECGRLSASPIESVASHAVEYGNGRATSRDEVPS